MGRLVVGWVGDQVVVGWVVGSGVGVLVRGVMGDGVLGGWCARGIIIFQGVLTKLKISMKYPHLSKFIDLMKELK